jgi:hypothetical protein
MSVTYSGSNNYGPCFPSVATTYAASTPSAPANAPGSPGGAPATDTATWNATNGEMSTQQFLESVLVVDDAQQGNPALTNVTSMTLAGYAPGTTQVFQFTGGYQKA